MATPPPGTPCGCTCTLRGHDGCTGVATTTVTLAGGQRGDIEYPSCENCSTKIIERARKRYEMMMEQIAQNR